MTAMTPMTPAELFERCLNVPYLHVAHAADFYTERRENTLYIYFQDSDGGEDWRNNLDFPARPYKRMGKTQWHAHRGFVRVWKEIEPYIAPLIADYSLGSVIVTGYSHGGALALLCHEYVWFHRPDLRRRIEGYGFGCPRVLWGERGADITSRWERFSVIRNIDDLVTHLPPRILGYFHVGRLIEIGEAGKYSRVDAHRAENIMRELWAYEEKGKDTSRWISPV